MPEENYQALDGRIDGMDRKLAEIKAMLQERCQNRADRFASIEDDLKRLEGRMEKIELTIAKWIGIGVAVSSLLSLCGGYILKHIFG